MPASATPLRSDSAETRNRLISAAEQLIATEGIDAVSFAAINRAAGQANRSATTYHFGDKAGLLQAIFSKHGERIDARRHAILAAEPTAETTDSRRLLEALVVPVVERLADPDGGRAYIQIRAQTIGHPTYSPFEFDYSDGARRLMSETVRLGLPVQDDLLALRAQLIVAMLFHGLADWMNQDSDDGTGLPGDLIVSSLIDAISAVLLSPASQQTLDQTR